MLNRRIIKGNNQTIFHQQYILFLVFKHLTLPMKSKHSILFLVFEYSVLFYGIQTFHIILWYSNVPYYLRYLNISYYFMILKHYILFMIFKRSIPSTTSKHHILLTYICNKNFHNCCFAKENNLQYNKDLIYELLYSFIFGVRLATPKWGGTGKFIIIIIFKVCFSFWWMNVEKIYHLIK